MTAELWPEIHERFDPEVPVQNKAWRVERDTSPARRIAQMLALATRGSKRFMILGSIGSGKSTELLAIAEVCAESGPVVLLDLVEHFDTRVADIKALQHVQAWEVVLLIGLAVFQAGELYGHSWDKSLSKEFERAGQAFVDDEVGEPTFDVAKLAGAVAGMVGGIVSGLGTAVGIGVGTGLVALGQGAGAGQWKFKIGLPERLRPHDQDTKVQRLSTIVNKLIAELQGLGNELTVIVDGLDRIEHAETTRALFVDSVLLGSLGCHTVLTGPIVLRRESLASHVRNFRPQVLHNLPVINRDAPYDWRRGGPGIDTCVAVFRQRVMDLGAGVDSIPEPQLRKLAFYSGGRMRDFVRLVRMVAEEALVRGLAAADEEAVDAAIDEWRRVVEMGLDKGHLEILRGLLDDPQLPADDRVSDMLNIGWILPYPNESEWYYPHPLLLKVKLSRPG